MVIKNKDILFGLIFLLLMIGAVSGAGFDWNSYGGNLNYITQSQFPNANGNFTASNMISINMTNGINLDSSANAYTPYQPLVSDLNGTQNYIIIQNGNYLQIYNQNLVLFQEIFTGSGLSQLDVTDFDGDGLTNDIEGVFEYNDTDYYFGVYSFNATTYSLNKIYSKNYTGNATAKKIAGIRCLKGNCYFINAWNISSGIYNQTFEQINNTNSSSFQLPNTIANEYYEEPVSVNDVDYDGKNEFLTFSKHKLILFRQDGTIVLVYSVNASDVAYRYIIGAKIFHPDNTNVWKIVMSEGRGASGSQGQTFITVLRPDNSTLWTKTYNHPTSTNYVSGAIAISNDYDGDGLNDIYMLWLSDTFTTFYNDNITIDVFRGTDGTLLASKNFSELGWGLSHLSYGDFGLTIANLNSGSKDDLIMNIGSHVIAYDIYNSQILFYVNSSLGFYGCSPADLYLRGSLDVVCSGTTGTQVFYTNFTNQNAVINSVSYNPSITAPVNSKIDAFISATDFEGNVLLYTHSCFDGDVLASESYSSTQSCYYTNVGTYNMTVYARDTYHSGQYSSFSQPITITQTGFFCNNNGTCDSGETISNCPNDCNAVSSTQQSTETGGSAIPTEIVDVNNANQGLLPEVYFGTLGFLSNTIQPMIILVFMIFFVLIILAIAFIIRKIGSKVQELGGR